MEVTGYQLMLALKELAFAKEAAESVFDNSLYKFADEVKPTPVEAMEALAKAETFFANTQAAQAMYNLAVRVQVQGEEMTLALAVKLVGSAGRMEKKWRDASKPKTLDRYDFRDSLKRSVEEGTEYATKQIELKDAQKLAKSAAKYATALREAVQTGNAVKIEIEGLNPALFE